MMKHCGTNRKKGPSTRVAEHYDWAAEMTMTLLAEMRPGPQEIDPN